MGQPSSSSNAITSGNSSGVNAQVLGTVIETIKNQPEMAKVTFQVKTQWQNGDGFKITSTGKDFQIGGQTINRREAFTVVSDFPDELGGMSRGPTVCEICMATIGSCISQTIVAYATMMGIQLDSIRIETEGDVDIRGLTGVSEKVRPGAQEFRLNIHLDSKTASKEQLEKLYELGKRFSPAVDTLTHGTTIKTTYDGI
jgi:putative redox protein